MIFPIFAIWRDQALPFLKILEYSLVQKFLHSRSEYLGCLRNYNLSGQVRKSVRTWGLTYTKAFCNSCKFLIGEALCRAKSPLPAHEPSVNGLLPVAQFISSTVKNAKLVLIKMCSFSGPTWLVQWYLQITQVVSVSLKFTSEINAISDCARPHYSPQPPHRWTMLLRANWVVIRLSDRNWKTGPNTRTGLDWTQKSTNGNCISR